MENHNHDELMKEFSTWIEDVKRLELLGEDFWNQPIAEGKWMVREVIAHIAKWDEAFHDIAIRPMVEGETLRLQADYDFNTFNAESAEYGRRTSITQIAQDAISYREAILNLLGQLDETGLNREYKDEQGRPFTVEAYLKDFIWHDRHHMAQIQQLMQVQE